MPVFNNSQERGPLVGKTRELGSSGRTILVIGRFQPFHRGHEFLLKGLSEGGRNFLKVAIGSSNRAGTADNPYTYSRRTEMIRSLGSSGLCNFSIFPVPDVKDDRKWLVLLLEKSGNFDFAVSGNLLVRRLFRGAGLLALRNKFFKRRIYSGTRIRKRMKKGLAWKGLVPKGVGRIIG